MRTLVFELTGCTKEVPPGLPQSFCVKASGSVVCGSVTAEDPESVFWSFYNALGVTGLCSLLDVEHRTTGLYVKFSPRTFGVHDVPQRFREAAHI